MLVSVWAGVVEVLWFIWQVVQDEHTVVVVIFWLHRYCHLWVHKNHQIIIKEAVDILQIKIFVCLMVVVVFVEAHMERITVLYLIPTASNVSRLSPFQALTRPTVLCVCA